jgi:hygromycin-B 4-O-kinase
MLRKPAHTHQTIDSFLRDKYAGDYDPGSLQQLTEGMESQAYTFSARSGRFVLRLNVGDAGFRKDRLCYETYGGSLPIPAVIETGAFDEGTFYCISRWMPGRTLEDLAAHELEPYLAPTYELLLQIKAQPTEHIRGYGPFDRDFRGQFDTWREYVLSFTRPEWPTAPGIQFDADSLQPVYDEITRLSAYCPENRDLIHGDFGSSNVLVQDGAVCAVLDWDCAAVGDYLTQVAGAHFWAFHLVCMEKQAAYYDRQLAHIEPHYHQRIRCYQLIIGLDEVYEGLYYGEPDDVEFMLGRLNRIMESR